VVLEFELGVRLTVSISNVRVRVNFLTLFVGQFDKNLQKVPVAFFAICYFTGGIGG